MNFIFFSKKQSVMCYKSLAFVCLLIFLCLFPVRNIFANSPINTLAQGITITGTVTDQNEPMPGVNINIKGTTRGVITDNDGKYSITVPNRGAVLVFSFVGYTTAEFIVGERNSIDVVLEEDTHQIGEVVVTALGIRRESKKIGYAMSSISAKELVKTGTTNFATALYGKASGVRIQAAPGGATSAVSINIRGLNSINATSQPLVIVDGVPIRNGDANNVDYWSDQRVKSNGLVDINPEDIAELSILKGASASALYGSEAANGVVMITTKSGKGKRGIGVDFGATWSVDKVAYMPQYQTTFGPGAYWEGYTSTDAWLTGDGWQQVTYNGNTYDRPRYESNQQFGPKYDGREVIYLDGTTRSYNAYKNGNGWNDLFRTGFNQNYNIAITNGGERSNLRFSYTFSDNQNVQRGSENNRHNFNLSGSVTIHPRVTLDYTANYMRQHVVNRPYRISRVTNAFSGMFTSFDDTKMIFDNAVTSLGYQNVFANAKTPTPDESFIFNYGAPSLVSEYYWQVQKNRRAEDINRFISSVTPTFQIMEGLSLRGRIATDLTSNKVEDKNSVTQPLAYGATGNYSLDNNRYEIYYGDVLLMFDRKIGDKFGLVANVGYQARSEQGYGSSVGTSGGLSVENWFNLASSVNSAKSAGMTKIDFLKQAFLGMLEFSYNDYLFLTGTVRQEKVSTLPPGHNSFFYPSVSASFLISEALRNTLPEWVNYAKARASWGAVGNSPPIYWANIAYVQGQVNNFTYNQASSDLGNDAIRPEEKYEIEFGLEGRLFHNRLGFEVSFYRSIIKDLIIRSTTPWTSGAQSILLNAGELLNRGWEISLNGTIIQSRDFRWDLRGNIGFNYNQVNSLMEGLDELENGQLDGAVRFVSRPGEKMGDIYAFNVQRDTKGNPIVDKTGLYAMNFNAREKVGNAMPDAVGGIASLFSWKNIFLDMVIDFNIGGDIVNTPYQYLMGRGALKNSMPGRDAEHGGLTYYVDASGTKIATTANQGPAGEKVRDDGMILSGVKEDGTPNDIIVSASRYYVNTYNWGASDYINYSNSVFDNTYIKMRELTLGYSLPASFTSKFGCSNLTVSIFGRNLFYFYKNLPDFDAEATDGTMWTSRLAIGGSTATTRSFGLSLRMNF